MYYKIMLAWDARPSADSTWIATTPADRYAEMENYSFYNATTVIPLTVTVVRAAVTPSQDGTAVVAHQPRQRGANSPQT